jgi:hypothetical protein
VALAKTSAKLPVEWTSHAQAVFALQAKTYTAALGALLLAKAVDDGVDALSIKTSSDNPRSYSLRSVGHSVLVPVAAEQGFSLRLTGREPLNNQPFFRYDRIDRIERVKNRSEFEQFLAIAQRADELASEGARLALAAFVKVALAEAAAVRAVRVRVTGLSADGAIIASEDFLRPDADDRPRRLQALAAACLDLTHRDVRTRKVNDPSRDLPGDVHAFGPDGPILAMEVRGKPVTGVEVEALIDGCVDHGVSRVIVLVDGRAHRPLDQVALKSFASRVGAHLMIFESAGEFAEQALTWSDMAVHAATAAYAENVMARLRQIEVGVDTLNEWARAVSVAR